jgi:hypothetical protein
MRRVKIALYLFLGGALAIMYWQVNNGKDSGLFFNILESLFPIAFITLFILNTWGIKKHIRDE